jgi:hypothetical protein
MQICATNALLAELTDSFAHYQTKLHKMQRHRFPKNFQLFPEYPTNPFSKGVSGFWAGSRYLLAHQLPYTTDFRKKQAVLAQSIELEQNYKDKTLATEDTEFSEENQKI